MNLDRESKVSRRLVDDDRTGEQRVIMDRERDKRTW